MSITKSIFSGVFALAITITTLANAGSHSKTYTMTVTDAESMEELISEWGPLAEALGEILDAEFNLIQVASHTGAAEAMRAGQVDFAFTGPAEYVAINKLTNGQAMIGIARPDYYCGIMVKTADGYTKASDLKGKTISFKQGSTSYHFCPMKLLADYGIDPMKDIKVVFTSKSLQHPAMVKGDTDGMGANVRSWIKYNRSKEPTGNGDYKVLIRSGDLPYDMIMSGGHIAGEEYDRVKQAIVDNEEMLLEALFKGVDAIDGSEAHSKYKGTRLVAVNDSDYDIVREMYVAAGLPEFNLD